jgi:DNA-binding transcriptional MerR regulator
LSAPLRTYRVREFAELAGVTVKALHYYDRLRLLRPARTTAGYRAYTAADLARLEQIVALRFLGIPLRKMNALLERGAPPLAATLRRQRQVLEEQRHHVDRAIDALREAERAAESGNVPPATILQKVIQIMTMQDVGAMRKYFSDDAWEQWKHHYDDWPSAEWQALYRDVAAAIDAGAGPSDARTQALADRWVALSQAAQAGADVRAGLVKAWADREQWPPVLRRKLAEFGIERALGFIHHALWFRWDAEREAAGRNGTAPPRISERRRLLYRDCAAILGENPAGRAAQAIVARWHAIVDDEAGGDDEVKAQMRKSFARRRDWPDGLKRYWASLHEMDAATWTRVADFIERADALSAPSAPRSPSGSSAPPPTGSSARLA